MADFIIINSTASELTDVNVGGDDVAAYTISAPITLTGAELLVVAALDGVAVMQTGASAAEKAAVAQLLSGGAAVGGTAVYTADPATGLFAATTLDATGLVAAIVAEKAVMAQGATQKERDLAAGILSGGTQSGKRTS